MPVLKGRYDRVKLWRPSGSLFAVGSAMRLRLTTKQAALKAVGDAFDAFYREHGHFPNAERVVVEAAGDSFRVRAAVYEITEE